MTPGGKCAYCLGDLPPLMSELWRRTVYIFEFRFYCSRSCANHAAVLA